MKRLFVCVCILILWVSAHAAAQTKPKPIKGARVVLAPRLRAGQTLHYQLDFRSHARGSSVSAIADPQGPREMKISVSVLTRVDVLANLRDPKSGAGGEGFRLRSTYEKLAATVRSDVPDPEAEESERQFANLEGKSFEFTMDKDGRVRDFTGLEGLSPEQAKAAREWLTRFATGDTAPFGGIVPGQKWVTQQDAGAALPLAGIKWVRESTYLRNEPCRATSRGPGAREPCAVILTRSVLSRNGNAMDATPEEYRAQGLKSSGTIVGTGESLTYISLTTGLVVSVTLSGTQQMDVTITTADGSSSVKYTADVKTESQLSLIAAKAPSNP